MPRRCRLCLRNATEPCPLFKSRIGDKLVTEIIWVTFKLELDKSVDFPKYVCKNCLRKVDYLYHFHQEIEGSQLLLHQLREEGKLEGIVAEQTFEEEKVEYHSDGILEEVEELEESIILSGKNDPVQDDVTEQENDELESIGCEAKEIVAEQLIDIKIETLESDNEFIVEHLSEELNEEPKSESDNDFRGFEELVPMKLEAAKGLRQKQTKRKSKQTVPKLDIVETIPNKCYICDNVSETRDLFDMHLIVHKNMLPYQCEECSTEQYPIEIKTLVLLNKHFESHDFNYVCDHCPLRFRSYPPLYDHTRNAHSETRDGFHCEMCGQMFHEIRKFQKHVRAHRNRETQRYKCETCQKSFQTGTILRRHERIHRKDSIFRCPFCDRGFNHESNFQLHKMRHIQQQSNTHNGHPCSVCETHFTNAIDWRNHMQQHFPDDPMYTTKTDILPASLKDINSYPRACEEPDCKYMAPSYQLMWSHYRKHYKMFQCQECGRKFATATILRTHIQVIHKKIRKFQCEFCPKTFAYQHKYKEHTDVHKGIKARKCRYCDKTFTHSSNLIVHERIHTRSRPYTCKTCGSTHVTTSALKKHAKTHEKNKTGEMLELYVMDAHDGVTENVIAEEEEVIQEDYGPAEMT
ncbi:zinc finger protein 564-like [Toxorhynchites rutilus septentrionalis]|uniref:zinc finger protein 564-like n=1 Tax=Toxorhynchites rutilus septentrionalis TaxID=329112 RepID=UPI0024790FDA|nr:zinc finger protein 564-like [Toxorhynchites rutilus septentrionalis]